MLSVTYAEYHLCWVSLSVTYAECHLCWVSLMQVSLMLSVTYKPLMLSVIMLNVIMLNVIMMSVVVPSVKVVNAVKTLTTVNEAMVQSVMNCATH